MGQNGYYLFIMKKRKDQISTEFELEREKVDTNDKASHNQISTTKFQMSTRMRKENLNKKNKKN